MHRLCAYVHDSGGYLMTRLDLIKTKRLTGKEQFEPNSLQISLVYCTWQVCYQYQNQIRHNHQILAHQPLLAFSRQIWAPETTTCRNNNKQLHTGMD